MSIGMPVWSAIQVVGQPLYTVIPDVVVPWQRIPQLTGSVGFGFGQGGFGQGGFGGGQTQSGTAQPVWTKWTTD
jgi:hypothetical protein